jgi:hypothetical protein
VANIFQTGDGEGDTLAVFSIVAPTNEWYRRAIVQALSMMCNPDNWTTQGDASVQFATNNAVLALGSLVIEEIE